MKDLVLVTGGTGYIGSHTAVELINSSYEVVIIDNLANSRIDSLDGIEKITGVRPAFEKIDLCDKTSVADFFSKYPNLKAVIHFAAHKAVGESVSDPLKYYHNNIASLINLSQVSHLLSVYFELIIMLLFTSFLCFYYLPVIFLHNKVNTFPDIVRHLDTSGTR